MRGFLHVALITPLLVPILRADPPRVELAELRVGQTEGDLCGNDGRVIQAASDHVANLGGGTVHGGIYLFECERVHIRACTVRNFNGDGISFQVSSEVIVQACRCENNAGHGLHPGSGSQRPQVELNHSVGNAADGMFVCWRVQHGRFENNHIRNNLGIGISIGHKDSDNEFRNHWITGNHGVGLFFRQETEPMGAHRNLFEKNVFLDNSSAGGKTPSACIIIRGVHHDLIFRENMLGFSQLLQNPPPALLVDPASQRLITEGNQMKNVGRERENRKGL